MHLHLGFRAARTLTLTLTLTLRRTDNCSHYFRVDKRLADNSNHNAAPHSVIDRFEIGRFG